MFKIVALNLVLYVSMLCTASAGEPVSQKVAKAVDTNKLRKAVSINGPQWGFEIGLRYAIPPFAGKDNSVTDTIPMFYYEGDHFFINGLEGGVHIWDNDQTGIDLFTRYRFFDFPEELDESLDHNTFDTGLRTYWMLAENVKVSAEIVTDFYGRIHGTTRIESPFSVKRWYLSTLLEVRGKTSQFNSRYYGLGIDSLDAGIDVRVGIKSRLQVWRNLHLEGSAEARVLDSVSRNSSVVEDSMEYMTYVGIGFFQEPKTELTQKLNAKPYIRLSQGWGNDSTLAQILKGNIRKDNVDVNMTSLFYGHPLADTLFGLPIEIYLTPGLVHHYSSSIQDNATEFVLGFKGYYTLPLPWRFRLGATEGISYIDSTTYYEAKSAISDNSNPSRLLNYLDMTIDLNLGDILHMPTLSEFWLGLGIHHRSGIGGSSPTFGNISGGSNYNTFYLQWSGMF